MILCRLVNPHTPTFFFDIVLYHLLLNYECGRYLFRSYLCLKEELARNEKLAEDFLKSEQGKRLQQKLLERSFTFHYSYCIR